MGLDAYIYRISKPELEDRVFTVSELSSMGLNSIPAVDFETNTNLYGQLRPYAIKRNVERQYYKTDEMISDYRLPSNSYIYFQSSEKIALCGTDDNGNRVAQDISARDVNSKYIGTEIVPYYIFQEEEEAYWRKNWDLVDWLEHNLKKPIENCGYYKLNKTLICRINSKFDRHASEESATKESAMFYWEWY